MFYHFQFTTEYVTIKSKSDTPGYILKYEELKRYLEWCILGFWRFIPCFYSIDTDNRHDRLHVLYYLTNLFWVIPLCTMFLHHKNKMHSQTQLHFQKNITLYMAACFSSYWIILRSSYKTFKTQQFFKLFALYCSEMSLILFLKILHCSVVHVNFSVSFKILFQCCV